jgi:RNA polymerase sigma factor (sigma-70 family)
MGSQPCRAHRTDVAGRPGRNLPSDRDADRELFDRVMAYLQYRRRQASPPAPLAEAWDRFYCDLAPKIRSFLLRSHMPEPDREDCLQEVWVWLIENLARLRYDPRRGRLSTWLMTVARNKAIDRIRHNRHLQIGLDEDGMALVDPGPEPGEAWERLWTQARVRTVLQELSAEVSERSYLVLHLRWIEGRTVAETAEALGLTPEQVSFRHHRMKVKFRALCERSLDLDLAVQDAAPDRGSSAVRMDAQGIRRSYV